MLQVLSAEGVDSRGCGVRVACYSPVAMPQSTTSRINAPASSRWSDAAVSAVGVLISVAALVLLARSIDLAAAGRLIGGAQIGPLILALAVLLTGLALRLVIWQVLLPPRANGSRASARTLAPILMIGFLGNAVLPARLGEVIRGYLVSRREEVSLGGALGSIALERVLDTVMLAVLAFVAAIAVGAATWIVRGTGLLATAGVAIVAALATTGLRPFLSLLDRLARFSFLTNPAATLRSRLEWFVYWSGGSHRRRAIWLTLALSAPAWLCLGAMFWLVSGSVGASISPAGAMLVIAVTGLVTAVPSAPGYLGTYEVAAVAVAVSLGSTPETALAAAVLSHLLSVATPAILGSVALVRMGGGLRALSTSGREAETETEVGLTAIGATGDGPVDVR
jgi:glycosyltransferase 2 family protein